MRIVRFGGRAVVLVLAVLGERIRRVGMERLEVGFGFRREVGHLGERDGMEMGLFEGCGVAECCIY